MKQINIGKISSMLDEMIELDKLKKNATDITCKSCYKGEYTKYSVLCDNSREYYCTRCGHVNIS